jgi:hypothetical protein
MSEDEITEDIKWMIKPVHPNEITIRVGDNVDKSVADKVKELVDSLNQPFQVAFSAAERCPRVSCEQGDCKPIYKGPCRTFITCRLEM